MTEKATPSFLDALTREVQTELNNASIYPIGSYGWLNEYEADPEFIGHAMWQSDQPLIDQSSLFGDGPVRRRPKDIEKEILTSGEDFCGVMEASRLSIGLSLLWKRPAQENPINESAFFWLHHTDAFLKLAIASDRLRDLLIVACTGKPPRAYKKKESLYVAPFEKAAELIAERGIDDRHLVEPISALPSIAHELAEYRRRRNAIVHDVATRMAQFVGETVSRLQRRYDQEQEGELQPGLVKKSNGLSRAAERRIEIQLEIDRSANELQEWYTLLIRSSNLVFQVEYWTRQSSAGRALS